MSELTNVFARNMRDLTTPTSTGVNPNTFDNAKIPIGNAPKGFESTEALTVKQIKDLAAAGRKEELDTVTLKISTEEIRAKEVEAALINDKANKATTLSGYGITDGYTQGQIDSKVINLENKKANKVEVETAFSNLSTTANKYYSTLAAANADIAIIALNQSVTIGEEANSGLWEKKTAGATSLTKTPYDPLTQSRHFTLESVSNRLIGVVSPNLVDKTAVGVTIGFFPSNNSGSLQANAAYTTTDYIPVVGGTEYTASYKHYWCWYDVNKVFISGTSDANKAKNQVAPVNAAYARLSSPNSYWAILQFELGNVSTPYIEYGVSLNVNTIQTESIDETKIKRKSLTPENVNFIKLGKNLFNKNTVVSDLIDPSNGNFVTTGVYKSSEFIRVSPNNKYSANSPLRTVVYYNVNKQLITGGVNDSNLTTFSFTSPNDAEYVRIGVRLVDIPSFQLEQAVESTPYEPYGYYAETPDGTQIFTAINEVDGNVITTDSITPDKTTFITSTKNLFNKSTPLFGKFISGTTGTFTDNAIYDTSDFIKVSPNTQYTANKSMRFHAFFNSSKLLVSGGSNNSSSTFTTNATTEYVRITLNHTDLDSFQLEKGSVSTGFEPFGYNLKGKNGEPFFTGIEQPTTFSSKWSGKAWATLGDSITAGSTWQNLVVSPHGFIWTNFGSGGTKISGGSADANAMCQDTRINAIPTTVDLITLMGGTNDWAQNVPLGDINSTDPLTFYGALNTFAQKAFTRWPAKRIAVATTPYGEIPDYTGRAGWTSPAHNSLGLTTNDYAEAIRQFCKRKNLHCIDVALSAGWGTYNITEALGGSTTDHLHPASGSNASKGIAIAHIKGLKDIEPI